MMKKRNFIIGASLVVVLLTANFVAYCSEAYAAQRADPGSFLVYKADSVGAFVNEIQANKTVTARYARHYGTSPDKLGTYFLENLQIKTLQKPYRTTVYYISKGNVIKQKVRVLKAGSRVFVGPDGLPLLEWRCGNPLGTKLPPAPKRLTKAKTNPAPDTGSPAPDWAVAPAPVLEIAAQAAEALPQAVPIAATPALALQNAVPAIGGAFAVPPSLLMLGGALPMLLGGVSVRTHSEAPVVPEPMSLVALTMGTSGVFLYSSHARRLRRRK
ncbi:MAG: hypothetical protein ACYC64_16400 [Armatimonadota bacterium]